MTLRAQPSAVAELVDGKVMDSSLISRRAGAAVAAMCPAMIGTAHSYSAAPVRAVLPCTVPLLSRRTTWRARVMCAGWIGSGVVVEFARPYDAGLRAWSVSIGQHRASRREAENSGRERLGSADLTTAAFASDGPLASLQSVLAARKCAGDRTLDHTRPI